MDKPLPNDFDAGGGSLGAVVALPFPAAPAPRDEHGALQSMILLAWNCHVRALRGEFLYAQQCLESAVDELLRLMRRCGGSSTRNLHARNPRRRLEIQAPELAHELLGIVLGTVDMPEVRLLELAERELKPHAPGLDWEQVASIRRRMGAD